MKNRTKLLIGLLIVGIILCSYCISELTLHEEQIYRNPRVVEGEYVLKLGNLTLITAEELEEANLKQGFPEDTPYMLRIWLSQPKEWDNQRDVKIFSVSPPFKQQKADPEFGNTLLYWDLSDVVDEGDINISIKFQYTAYETYYDIDPEKIGQYDKDSDLYKLYTREENWIEFTPEVEALVEEIVDDEENPYLQAKRIYDWLIDNMEYRYPAMAERGVKYSLPRRSGDCGEYSLIFIACCRYLGIPARPVLGGLAIPGEEGFRGHAWAEFYLPNYGWIPVDATYAQGLLNHPENAKILGVPNDRYYYFGHLDNKRIIYSKGMNIKLEPPIPQIFSKGRNASFQPLIPSFDDRITILQPYYPLTWGFDKTEMESELKISRG